MTCHRVVHNLELMWPKRQLLQNSHLSEMSVFCELNMLPPLSCHVVQGFVLDGIWFSRLFLWFLLASVFTF